MVFERTKTVGGHQYKYLVENVRENGKTKQRIVKYLGRADKEQKESSVSNSNGSPAPYGLYYFGNDECGGCESKDRVEARFSVIKSFDNSINTRYINTHNQEEMRSVPIVIEGTPTIIEFSPKYVYILMWGWEGWADYKFGEEKGKMVLDAMGSKVLEIRQAPLIKLIREGKKYKELRAMDFDKDDIKACMEIVKAEKKNKCKGTQCQTIAPHHSTETGTI